MPSGLGGNPLRVSRIIVVASCSVLVEARKCGDSHPKWSEHVSP